MNFCSACGSANIALQIPEGDNKLRYVCADCGCIYYQNPKIVTGCLAVWEQQILLCRRAIEPRYGLWTLPAGFMENGESLEQAAQRETWEEAQAKVNNLQLYTITSLPRVNQVYVMFRGELLDTSYACGIESLEVELFSITELPWHKLAFRVIEQTLNLYCSDAAKKQFKLHVDTID
jgi:ADP-ribose pyrophosphatase YjhB (NUDIX family)